jgi:hypothetical protein
MKKSKLINSVLLVFSVLVCTMVALPIVKELDSTLAILILVAVHFTGIVFLTKLLQRKLNEYILSEIERFKRKHIREFFDFMERDTLFTRDVLVQKIPVYNDDREKIGSHSVYRALSEKMRKYLEC